MNLDSFVKEYTANSLITKQGVEFDQINNLIDQAGNELAVCKKILEISPQVAFTCAYTAMLYAARAFMLLKGYRPIRNNQHRTVIVFIDVCVGRDYKILIQKFDNMRQKRNLVMYEPWGINISKTDTQNAIKSAEELIGLMIDRIKKEDPQHEFKFG